MSAPLTPEQRETLGALWRAHALDPDPRIYDAIRAALSQPARTCGNCHYAHEWPDGAIGCQNTRGLNRDEVDPGDGCILGWRARETETPT